MFEVRIDDRDLMRLGRTVKSLGGNMGTVMSSSLNKTATTARVRIGRRLAATVGSSVKKAKDSLSIGKASRTYWKSTVYPASRSYVRTPVILLTSGSMKQGRPVKPIRYRSEVRRKTILLKYAFYAVMPSGHKGIFERSGRSDFSTGRDERGRLRKGRLPIYERGAELIWDVLREKGGGERALIASVQSEMDEVLAKNIHDQVKLILKRRAG
jgi:hypothetical protein